jgi:hypothetical protein
VPKNVKLGALGSLMFQRTVSVALSGSLSVYCNCILLRSEQGWCTCTVHLFSGFEHKPKSMLLLAKSMN